jgi:hypothetical protein
MRSRFAALALVFAVSGAALAAACGETARPTAWKQLASAQPGALLSVWGTSTDDIWAVGGRGELAGKPTVLHFNGNEWERHDADVTGVDLWWVFGFERGNAFFTGSGGTILHYHDAWFEPMVTPRSGIVFGLWGAAPDDLWAVGAGDDGKGIVWRYDGEQWRDAGAPADTPAIVLKVHGQSRNDVWISCASGVTLHWDGTALTRVPTGVTSSLFSIVTTPDAVIAVGGRAGAGDIVEHSGAGWTVQPNLVPVAWRGVTASGDTAYAVGEMGVVAQRIGGQWSFMQQSVTQLAFHAAWIDPEGGLWGVGGMFDTLPLTSAGFLTYYGTAPVAEVVP